MTEENETAPWWVGTDIEGVSFCKLCDVQMNHLAGCRILTNPELTEQEWQDEMDEDLLDEEQMDLLFQIEDMMREQGHQVVECEDDRGGIVATFVRSKIKNVHWEIQIFPRIEMINE